MPARAGRRAAICWSKRASRRVVAALGDPDPRTDGKGHDRLRAAGIAVETGARAAEARRSMAGFLTRQALGRPHVTLKLATSLDGCIALAIGESKWITGAPARAHAHLERARHEAILVGRGTYEADAPTLDVRLEGLEDRSPRRLILPVMPALCRRPASRSDGAVETGPRHKRRGDGRSGGRPAAIAALENVDHLLVEGGAQTAAAFLAADLVDRLLLYRAPILIGGGKPALGDIGLTNLADAHGRWRLRDRRMLGIDTLRRIRASPHDMFTGIITDIGTIESVEQRGDLRVRIATAYDTASVDLGASISCSGVCLTVIDKAPGLVHRRRVGRNRRAHRAGAMERGPQAQPRTRDEAGRRARRAYRHGPCRRRRRSRARSSRRAIRASSRFASRATSRRSSRPRDR